MKVKVTVPFVIAVCGVWQSHTTDDVVEIADDAEARRLIAAGYALPVNGEAAPVIETGALPDARTAETLRPRRGKRAD